MRIGIIGAGSIGGLLARKLAAAGHAVTIANSRGPDTIGADILSTGARPAWAADAVRDVDVLIVSIPLLDVPAIAPLVAALPADAIVIDTSNYYPYRDGRIEAIEAGQIESLWVAEQLGRPIVKAWNAVLAGTLEHKGAPVGAATRLAIPVAADADEAKRIAMALVDASGFDPVEAGALAESWRQQPGQPIYCTELGAAKIGPALAAADRAAAPGRRDELLERSTAEMAAGHPFSLDWVVAMNRASVVGAADDDAREPERADR